MTQDEIIEMARQAGFFINYELTITSPFIEDICISPMLKEFAKLVAAKERKACADLCATWYDPMWADHNQAGNELATAIRARGEA